MATLAVFTTPTLIGLAVSAATATLAYLLTPAPPDQVGPKRDDLTLTTSAYGKFRPILYGRIPTAGNIFDGSDYHPTRHKTKVGGKGGKSSSLITYTYSIDLALGLGEGPIGAVEKIYANEKLIYDINGTVKKASWLNFVFYPGSEDQMPDPILQTLHGVENTPAYRGEAYIMFEKFQLEDFGGQIPSFRVLCVKDAVPAFSEEVVNSNYLPMQNLQDFSTAEEAILRHTAVHPVSGNIFYSWDWLITPAHRINPIITICDPYQNRVILNINRGDVPYTLNAAVVNFGYIGPIQDKRAYGSVTLVGVGNAEAGENPDSSIFSQDLENGWGVVGTLEGSRLFDGAIDVYGPLIADSGVFVGLYNEGFQDSWFRLWSVVESGETEYVRGGADASVEEGLPFQPRPGWRVSNPRMNTTAYGSVIIYGLDDDLPAGNQGFITQCSFTPTGFNVSWDVDIPDEFMATDSVGYLAVTHCVSTKKRIGNPGDPSIWWSIFEGKIWGFNGSTGVTVGIWDVSGDPKYRAMSSKPTYDPDTKKLYWIARWFNPDTQQQESVPQSWNTATYELELYELNSTVADQNFDPVDCDFNQLNGAIYSSTSGVTRATPSRKFNLDGLTSGVFYLSEPFSDVCDRCGIPPANYDVSDLATTPYDGYRIGNLATGRGNLGPLQHGYMVDTVDSGGVLKFIRKGKPAVASLTVDDLGASVNVNPDEPLIKITRVMESDLPANAEILYLNIGSNYETGNQSAQRQASVNTNTLSLDLAIAFDDTTAKQRIDTILHVLHIERESYKLKVMPKWQILESGDVIDVNDGDDDYTMQIVRSGFVDGLVEIEAVRTDPSVFSSPVIGDAAPDKDDVIYHPGTMLFQLLDTALLQDGDDNPGFYTAATGDVDDWQGGIIFKSPDGSAWNTGSTFTSPSTYATVNNVIPAPVSPWQWDNVNTLLVNIPSGDLFSVSEEETLQGFNSAAYGAQGRWEIINYMTVVDLGTGYFEVSGLIRGRLGTEHNMGNHAVGDVLIPLTVANLQYMGNELSNIGSPVLYRGASFGVNVYDQTNIQTRFTNTAVCLTPLSPQHIKGRPDTDLNLTITWMPRSRYSASDFWSGTPSETDDLYDIEMYADGQSEAVHTVTDNPGQSYLWLRTDQISELSAVPQVVDVRVWHKSQRVGRGYEGFGKTVIGEAGPVPYYDAVDFLSKTIVHYKTDENYPAPNGLTAFDSKGAADGVYYETNEVLFNTSGVPSNLVGNPNDKQIHCTEANWGDRLEVPAGASDIFNTGDTFSIAFVAKIRNVKTSLNLIRRIGHFRVEFIDLNYKRLRFSVTGSAGEQSVVTETGDITDPEVTKHFVFTCDGSKNELKIFINTALASGGNGGVDISDVSQPTSVATYIAPEYVWFDDFIFCNDVLTQNEINYIFSNTGL